MEITREVNNILVEAYEVAKKYNHEFVTAEGMLKDGANAPKVFSVDADIFERGLCLPSDNKMTPEEQDVIIDIIHRCFE